MRTAEHDARCRPANRRREWRSGGVAEWRSDPIPASGGQGRTHADPPTSSANLRVKECSASGPPFRPFFFFFSHFTSVFGTVQKLRMNSD